MTPTLRPGDLVAVRTRPAMVKRGAVVVLRNAAGLEIVKRAVAVGGDRYRGRPVPANHVFVAGDNAQASTDSREFGAVALDRIEGVARFVYWPPQRWKPL
jgi:type IV secretory pathway protease TraF